VRFELEFPEELVEEIVERVLERLPTASEFLTPTEAAELLRAKPQRVYDLLSSGRLTRHKDGSRVLVSRAELVAHLLPQGSQVRTGAGVAR
jgi:excisionase family DNA binding protein